ncbi:hypothetical protein VKT23_019496 [Stygiomarasmius scandens]|uniref:Uncharacterized protein n=1 Tax=Marasmiellus scandens TaxID=2682957 RepID=A0ABR1ILK4_9AGAR
MNDSPTQRRAVRCRDLIRFMTTLPSLMMRWRILLMKMCIFCHGIVTLPIFSRRHCVIGVIIEGAFPSDSYISTNVNVVADASDMMSSPIFDSDKASGLGKNGDCTDTDCLINDGAFKDVALAYPMAHRLRRNITFVDTVNRSLTKDFSADHISQIMQNTTGDFFTFQYRFSHIHNNLHFIIGGDMNSECPSGYPKELCDLTSFASNGNTLFECFTAVCSS